VVTPSGVWLPVEISEPSYWAPPRVPLLSVRVDSASLPRPSRPEPALPWVDTRLPPSLLRRPPDALLVPAPPREGLEVVPPEVPLPVLEVPFEPPPFEAAPPLAATLFLVAVPADARPRLDELLLEAEVPPLRVAEEPLRLAELPLLAVARPPAALRDAEEPLLADDFEALREAPPLEALLEPPPLEAAPPLAATLFLVAVLADARPRLDEPPFEAVLRPPEELLELPPLEAEDLEAPLEVPPLEAFLEPLLFEAELRPPAELLEPPPLEAAPPLAATLFLVALLADARPRLDEPLLEAEDPPRDAEDPPREDEDFDAPPLREAEEPLEAEDLEAPLEPPPLAATLFLVALLADARPLEEDPLEALPLLAVLRPPEELLEALLDALPREALPLEADDPLLDAEEELLEEEPPRLEDELLLADFLEAALEEELPPALLLPAFLAAAFLVDVAIFNGFCVRVNKICVLKLQRCK
jgi:hypothetical protein